MYNLTISRVKTLFCLQQAVAEQQLAQQRAQQQVAAAAAAVAAGATSQVAIMQGQQVVTTATTIQVSYNENVKCNFMHEIKDCSGWTNSKLYYENGMKFDIVYSIQTKFIYQFDNSLLIQILWYIKK